jgi:hypothetical protein
MTTVHTDLSGLVRAELANDEVAAAGDHLRGCPVCRDGLVDTAVGHALLARSGHTLGSAGAERPGPAATVADLEAAFPDERPPRHRPRQSARLVAWAAALVIAAGVGAAAHATVTRDQRPQPQRSALLQAVAGAGGGTVSMLESAGRTSMTISTRDLPAAGEGRFYYAWLLDPGTNKMLPLGQVGPSGTASFEVSDALLAAYSAVDVSLEDDDGDPQHSPTSVLRATYA